MGEDRDLPARAYHSRGCLPGALWVGRGRRRPASLARAACEREHDPAVRMLGSQRLGVMIARVVADDVAPELEAGAVRVRDADDPVSTNRIPQLSGRLPANTMPPIAAQDEELRDVEIVGIRSRRRSPGDEREARDLAAARDEKCGASIRLRPVARQLLVSESSIGTEPYAKDLAHVMDVELEQIGQERGRLWPNSVDADQFRFPQSILLKLTKPGIEVGNLWL